MFLKALFKSVRARQCPVRLPAKVRFPVAQTNVIPDWPFRVSEEGFRSLSPKVRTGSMKPKGRKWPRRTPTASGTHIYMCEN